MSLRDMWKTVGQNLAKTGEDLGNSDNWGSLGRDIAEAGKSFGKAAVKSTQKVADKAGGWVDSTMESVPAQDMSAYAFLGRDGKYLNAMQLLAREENEYTKLVLQRAFEDIAAHRKQYEREILPAAAELPPEEAARVAAVFESGAAELNSQLTSAFEKAFRSFDARTKAFFEANGE